jgi:hypothetical protein
MIVLSFATSIDARSQSYFVAFLQVKVLPSVACIAA